MFNILSIGLERTLIWIVLHNFLKFDIFYYYFIYQSYLALRKSDIIYMTVRILFQGTYHVLLFFCQS